MLLVNVASKCGFTPQYKGLEAVYEQYKDKGLVIVGFPANNFGGQEPGTNEEIQTFCSRTYNVTFPMMSKISVKGDDQAAAVPFPDQRRRQPGRAGDIKWNFTKFLVGRDGKSGGALRAGRNSRFPGGQGRHRESAEVGAAATWGRPSLAC